MRGNLPYATLVEVPATRRPSYPSPVAVPILNERRKDRFTALQSMSLRSSYQSGHYPSLPIYPGVFFIESVISATRAYFGRAVSIDRVENVRFVSPGMPGESFTVVAQLEDPVGRSGVWRVSASCCDEHGRMLAEMALHLALEA